MNSNNITFNIGTDCSGLDAPIVALERMNIKFNHIFSSDIDEFCRLTILANHSPRVLFKDMFNRDITLLPPLDMYICGFPCQSFSVAGKGEGFNTLKGTVFFECIRVIGQTNSTVFILENVKGLITHDKGETLKTILKTFKEELPHYLVKYKILNTKDFKIPQSRSRVYFVGIHKNVKNRESFTFPIGNKSDMENLKNYIDHSDTRSVPWRRQSDISKVVKDSIFVDADFIRNSRFPNSDRICPCILARSALYNMRYNRPATCKEYLMLQGFPVNYKKVVSTSQFKKQIGNSMSINVLVAIFEQIFKTLKIA